MWCTIPLLCPPQIPLLDYRSYSLSGRSAVRRRSSGISPLWDRIRFPALSGPHPMAGQYTVWRPSGLWRAFQPHSSLRGWLRLLKGAGICSAAQLLCYLLFLPQVLIPRAFPHKPPSPSMLSGRWKGWNKLIEYSGVNVLLTLQIESAF